MPLPQPHHVDEARLDAGDDQTYPLGLALTLYTCPMPAPGPETP